MVTTDTIDKHVGNYVTVLGQVKSTESSSCIISDGSGKMQISYDFDESINEGWVRNF